MATVEERNILATKILQAVGASHASLPPEPVTGFLSIAGHLYQGSLMVVGRAVNGFYEGILPASLMVPEEVCKYTDMIFNDVKSENEECPMSWVTKLWGGDDAYNTIKSAFWRVIRAVVCSLGIANVDLPQWPSHLVWSNLYKVSPADGGNPGGTLCNIQLPGCIDLLRLELDTYKPKRLLFLTGMNWAKPFLDVLGIPVNENHDLKYVEGFGQANLTGGHQLNFVIACHPARKQETHWVNEVHQVFNQLTGE
ncbi:MAG: hypothetical protein HQK96_13725 [Nitrospirae bacterium]|nr:hypothetical protein [Nitrospirota bacterium]